MAFSSLFSFCLCSISCPTPDTTAANTNTWHLIVSVQVLPNTPGGGPSALPFGWLVGVGFFSHLAAFGGSTVMAR